MKTKTNLRIAAAQRMLAAIVLLGVCMFTHAPAQVIVPPVNADNFAGPVGYPNSSTIDYSNYYCAPPLPQLTAMVTDGGVGGPAPQLLLKDHSLPLPMPWLPAPIPAPPGCSPDVIIGNDASIPGNYLIAVVATVPCGLGGNDIYLFTYTVAGPAPFVTPAIPLATYNISNTCHAVGPAHIDIIDEYSNPVGSCSNLPFANKFVVTWQDATQGIMGYFANLNNPAGGAPPTVINSNLHLSSPDVAAVERAGSCSFEDWALFTYVDQITGPNDILYYQEWKITPTTAIFGPTVYDNTLKYFNASPNFVSVVRIDAIDDYNYNTPPACPGGPANAYFDIVASAFVLPVVDIVQYNNVIGPLPPLAAIDISAPVFNPLGLEKGFVPQVACGPGQFYTVGYASNGVVPTAYYATGIDWGTGTTTTSPNAFQVNLNPYAPPPGFPFGIAVSASSNVDACPAQQLFTGFENGGAVFNKYSTSLFCVPYVFKPARVPGITTTDEWQLSPNPGNENVTLVAPSGFSNNDGATYTFTDLSGKTILANKVSSAAEEVNVKDLPSGMYLISITTADKSVKTLKFVKD